MLEVFLPPGYVLLFRGLEYKQWLKNFCKVRAGSLFIGMKAQPRNPQFSMKPK